MLEKNMHKNNFKLDGGMTLVEIGTLIHPTVKNAIIIEPTSEKIDSIDIKLYHIKNNTLTTIYKKRMKYMGNYHYQFHDLNNDGYKELIVSFMANKSVDFYFIYDNSIKSFRQINHTFKYNELTSLESANYLYSYRSCGGADFYWNSYLVKIENFKIKEYAKLYNNDTEILFILKNKIIKKLPLNETLDKYSSKFEFINKFWQNYVKN